VRRVVDTNVVVRVLVDDDPGQAERAQRVLDGDDVLVLKNVVLEAEWVLRSVYRLPRPRIAEILRGVMGLPRVTVEDAEAVGRALNWFEAGLDFADAVHLAATPAGAEFVSFDRDLARRVAGLAGAPAVREP
jgi:predicted nucleic-acid-binding protein